MPVFATQPFVLQFELVLQFERFEGNIETRTVFVLPHGDRISIRRHY